MLDQPRSFWGLFFHWAGWVVILWIASFFLLFFWLAATQQANHLAAYGIDTTASIVHKERIRFRQTTFYRLDLSFLNQKGKNMSQEADVSEAKFSQVQVGSHLNVRYDPSDTRIVEVEPGRTKRGAEAFGFLALVLFGFGAVTAGIATRWVRQALAIREQGERRLARVIDIESSMRTFLKPERWKLKRAIWRDEKGALGMTWWHFAHELPAQGNQITVYAKEMSWPKCNAVWEGDVGPRLHR